MMMYPIRRRGDCGPTAKPRHIFGEDSEMARRGPVDTLDTDDHPLVFHAREPGLDLSQRTKPSATGKRCSVAIPSSGKSGELRQQGPAKLLRRYHQPLYRPGLG